MWILSGCWEFVVKDGCFLGIIVFKVIVGYS